MNCFVSRKINYKHYNIKRQQNKKAPEYINWVLLILITYNGLYKFYEK